MGPSCRSLRVKSMPLLLAAFFAASPGEGRAQEGKPAPKPAPPVWDLKLGFSYLATAGNTDTSSSGINVDYRREQGLWSFESSASAALASRAKKNTAEAYNLQLRSQRKITDELRLSAGLRGERNRFAGIELRTITDASLAWALSDGPVWKVRTLGGLSWTREDRKGDRPVDSSIGGLLQLNGTGKLSPTAELDGQLIAYPDLEDSDDYRIDGRLSVQASLNRHLSIRFGYDLKYDNEPVPGFQRTDSTSTASLVVQLGRKAG